MQLVCRMLLVPQRHDLASWHVRWLIDVHCDCSCADERLMRILQGTLLRTAVALGWEACFLLPGCCDPFNDKALKAGRGAAFKISIAEGDWMQLQQVLQQHKMTCYGAAPHKLTKKTEVQTAEVHRPKSIDSARTGPPAVSASQATCIVLGSEGQGLSNTARQHSTPLAIPMVGPMESLNVSQAGAILMFALSQQAAQLYQQLHHNS